MMVFNMEKKTWIFFIWLNISVHGISKQYSM